jgi:hypothetical protein
VAQVRGEGTSDGENPLSYIEAVRVPEPDAGEIVSVDSENGKIALWICPDHFGFKLALVHKEDGYLIGILNHVVVGKDITVYGVYNDAGAEGLAPAFTFRGIVTEKIVSEELFKRVLEPA